MKLIVECSQKLVRLGENLWGKEQKLDKETQEHQKLCDEIMAIQGIEPIEAEMEQIIHCPEGYQFKDENGNVINAQKIVLEKKKKEYPKTYEECRDYIESCYDEPFCADLIATGYKSKLIESFARLLICRDTYWKIAGEEMGLGKPWKPDWKKHDKKYIISVFNDTIIYFENETYDRNTLLAFPTEEMRDAFKENFDPDIEICKELL